MLLGLIGWPLTHTLSPPMHNAAAADLGIDAVYVPLPVPPDRVEAAVKGLPALGFRGVNVTVPHKQAVMRFLHEISPAARAIGAVNTIVVAADGQMSGTNTDWSGFSADLDALHIDYAKRDALVLGAGGSARAIVYALGKAGCTVHVCARRVAQSTELCAQLQPHLPDAALNPHALEAVPTLNLTAPLIVNTTPLGMTPNVDGSVWHDTWPFPADATVYDLVYTPATTRLMRQAAAAGVDSHNGLGMLLYQGAHAFERWTGRSPNLDVMRAHLHDAKTK